MMKSSIVLIHFLLMSQVLSAQLDPTPFVDKGPLYPVNTHESRDNDLTIRTDHSQRAIGEVIELRGTILDTKGNPIKHADLLIWQTDNEGYYEHPKAAQMMGKNSLTLDPNFQYWGKTISDDNGNYYFKTIIPQPYLIAGLQRPAHVHMEVKHAEYKYLSMELHFPNDQYLEDDQVTAHLDDHDHELLMAKITIPPNGIGPKIVGFNIVLDK